MTLVQAVWAEWEEGMEPALCQRWTEQGRWLSGLGRLAMRRRREDGRGPVKGMISSLRRIKWYFK